LPQTTSRQRFVLNVRTVTEDFRAIYNLEEEMMATLSPVVGTTEEQKDEARVRILGTLIRVHHVTGSWVEIRSTLGLEDIRMSLFKRSCWHLSEGDRDVEGKPRIKVTREVDKDRTGLYERPPFIITAM
jgi:hypothetical protein